MEDSEPPSATGLRPSAGASVDITDRTGRLGAPAAAWLRELLLRAMSRLGVAGEVSACVLDDAAMAAAHERHSGVEGTTDVLTFDLGGGADGLDVELLLCLDEAERQAAPRGHGAREELLLYAVHGLLHCCGFDDHDDAAAARMHAEEDRILAELGVGAVFSARGGGAEP